MSKFFEAFEVYNRNKHAPGDAKSRGGNHSNIGTGNTTYMFAREYRGPNKVQAVPRSQEDGQAQAQPQMVDVSKLSREEFEAMYYKMHPETPRGEPNNKVNF
ncbi:YMR107W [Kluyveromyces marxianus]|uniref:Stationary phase protein 4 n=2 Tax=Kluyveromyces marxianus TaxID=4911 RepID=W0T9C7_KLUMD|nr:uncharacterized protein KLMA_30101 [Kluyveromyces marxianus DMKU3-1042]QGN15118.1 YMR107W [Kluyveromyces marxianus]BAO39396.1 uncharacterized protein YMR107W [Kluyveromyces marxianus DMKU3-1042]